MDSNIKNKQKDLSLELLKFLAMILIINTHMEMMYPKYSSLATGGTIGDALFMFCSGYTLFLGRLDRFDNWYKRRICRIYPSVLAWSIVALFVFGISLDMKDIIISGGKRWFISCIMIYYVVLYHVRKYLLPYKWAVFTIACIVPLVWYFVMEDGSTFFMYRHTYFKYFYWFPFMLGGAFVGSKSLILKRRPVVDGCMAFVCFISHYAIMIACTRYQALCPWQPLSLVPLFGLCIYLYKIGQCSKVQSFMNKKIGEAIQVGASLCLEAYIVQYPLFTTKMNNIFPANLLIMILYVLLVAYVVRTIGRIIKQTFEKEDFRWKEIIRLI